MPKTTYIFKNGCSPIRIIRAILGKILIPLISEKIIPSILSDRFPFPLFNQTKT